MTCKIALLAVCVSIVGCKAKTPDSDNPPAGASSVPAGDGRRPDTLVVGVTPYLGADNLRESFEPLVRYLGAQLGLSATLMVASDYGALARLVETFEVHVAVFSPFAYVEAKAAMSDLALLATQIADGSPTYSGYVVARDDTQIRTLRDLSGKRFGFVDKQSTSGWIYPRAYLVGEGIDPERFFGSVVFAGNHNRLIDLVLSKNLHGGATYSAAYKIARQSHPEGGHLRVLAKTGRIPYDAYCASGRLASDLRNRVKEVLLGLSTRTEQGREVLVGMVSINGFVAVDDAHYDSVRQVAATLGDAP